MNSAISFQQPTFRANINDKFLNAADGYLKNRPVKEYKQFCSAIRRFHEVPKSDNINIEYKKTFQDGKEMHSLFAIEKDKEPIVLATKDQFRKLIQKFIYMNEYEFKIKTGLIEK